MQQEQTASSAHFITLTYDTLHIPITPNGLLTLSKTDVQLFLKRLRKKQCGILPSPIRYYCVGEYGGRTQRPHYHIILFNAELELIQPAWKQGHIYYGKVSGASVGYTLKYMSKNKKQFRKNPDDDRHPEFGLMSKGLGLGYLTETMAEWHIADLEQRMYCMLPGGVKIAMPRYYKDKLYLPAEKAAIAAFYQIQMDDIANEKLAKQTIKSMWNEQQAIDAAFDRMYLSCLKTKL